MERLLQLDKYMNASFKIMLCSLNVQTRDTKGTAHSRRLRYSGMVPGIIYGAGKAPLPISVSEKELNKEYSTSAFFNKVFTLDTGNDKEKVLPKDVSIHPVTGNILHVDFMRISKGTKIKIFVPVEMVNEDKSPGIKKGGIVNLVVHKLECLSNPESIPEKIVLDLAGKEIGESFLLNQTSLPEGVEAVNPERDNVLATIVISKIGKEDDKQDSGTATVATTDATATTKSEK